MRYREPAICLRTTDYSETSQVVHFLTRQAGIVRLMAKGTKRPKSKSDGALDLFSEGELVFTLARGEGLGILIEFTDGHPRPLLRKEFKRLYVAMYMIELAGAMLAEGDPHPEVFDLLHNGLDRLAQEDSPVSAVLAYYQWRLLRHVGLLGELRECVSCGVLIDSKASAEVWFSSSQGGVLCKDCEVSAVEKYRVDPETRKGLETMAQVQRDKVSGRKAAFPEAQAEAVNKILAYHIACQLGRPLKMMRYVIS